MTHQFAYSVLKSRKMQRDLIDEDTKYLKSSFKRPQQIYTIVLSYKNINTERHHVVKNMKLCIEDMIHVNKVISDVKMIRETRYDEANEKHEELLDALWMNFAQDGDKKTSPEKRDWTKLGFQRRDEPRTDFRGMGELGLLNLVAFSETSSGKRLLMEAQTMDYSFAITGINLTADLYKYLSSTREGKYRFMNRQIESLPQFNEIYGEIFVRFHQYWKERNPSIMEFNQVKEDFWREMEQINFWRVPRPNA